MVKACAGYYTVDGKVETKSIAQNELNKSGYMNVYEYDAEQVEEAIENGSVLGVDWSLKFQSI